MSEYDEQEVAADVEPSGEDQGAEGEAGPVSEAEKEWVEGPADPERFPSMNRDTGRPEDKFDPGDVPVSSYELPEEASE